MSTDSVAALTPSNSDLAEVLSEEDKAGVRAAHQAGVEQWLDRASFAKELFDLHTKYGIERGEAGYRQYCTYLMNQYNAFMATRAPARDPLGEGCTCLYCQFDEAAVLDSPAEEKPAAPSPPAAPRPEPSAPPKPRLQPIPTAGPKSLTSTVDQPVAARGSFRPLRQLNRKNVWSKRHGNAEELPPMTVLTTNSQSAWQKKEFTPVTRSAPSSVRSEPIHQAGRSFAPSPPPASTGLTIHDIEADLPARYHTSPTAPSDRGPPD